MITTPKCDQVTNSTRRLTLREAPYMPHCYSQFHSEAPTATHSFTAGLPHFRMSKSNHSFPHWQGGVKRLPAALHSCHVSYRIVQQRSSKFLAWEGELIRGRFGATPSPLPAVNLVIIPSALTLFLYLECCIVVVFGLSNHSFLLQGMGKVAVGSRQ